MDDGTGRNAVEVLLVEDDHGDVVMITEAFEQSGAPVRLHVVGDGDQAMQFLRRAEGFAEAPQARPDRARPQPAAPQRLCRQARRLRRLHRRDPADRPLVPGAHRASAPVVTASAFLSRRLRVGAMATGRAAASKGKPSAAPRHGRHEEGSWRAGKKPVRHRRTEYGDQQVERGAAARFTRYRRGTRPG